MLEIRLHQIKEILKSDADAKIKQVQCGPNLKTIIKIEDNRFHNIRQLVKQIEQKNNENYRKLIELISDYIGQIYDKKDFDNGTVCSNYYNNKQEDANYDFAERLFNYICKVLKTNPNIKLSVKAIENLLRIQQNIISDKLSSPESEINLINILIKNKTLEKSNISTYQKYQILMKSDRISDQYALPYLITPKQFNENHKLIDEFLKRCDVPEFINVMDIIKDYFDEKFNILPFIFENKNEYFVENLIYELNHWRPIKADDFDIILAIFNNKNLKIDFNENFYISGIGPISLFEIICSYKNNSIIKAMLEHPNANICELNSHEARISLCKTYCYIKEFEKFLNELNKNVGTEHLGENKNIDNIFKQASYISLNNYPESLRTDYILTICDSLKTQNIDYERLKHIIELIINDDNLNYFELDDILPKLQELLSKDDFKDLLNVIAQRQKEGKLTLIKAERDQEERYKFIINKISIKEFEEITIEYIGHQKSIGTYPTAQNDDSQDD